MFFALLPVVRVVIDVGVFDSPDVIVQVGVISANVVIGRRYFLRIFIRRRFGAGEITPNTPQYSSAIRRLAKLFRLLFLPIIT